MCEDRNDDIQSKILDLSESMFKDIAISTKDPIDVDPIYAEVLLQQSLNANKYYQSFQRYTRQFINDENTHNSIVRWTNSSIESTSRLIIESWHSTDYNGDSTSDTESDSRRKYRQKKTVSSALFSWSSGDLYIEARKKELQQQRSNNKTDPLNKVCTTRSDSKEDKDEIKPVKGTAEESQLKNSIKIAIPKESITNKLNRIIDKESNKFIHRRIQLIKAHHSEQMSKQIHERKRKDHELYLKKLRLKEEEYEKAIHDATYEQNHGKQGGFFGSLFGFNNSTTSGSNISDTELSRRPSIDGNTSIPSTSVDHGTPPSNRSKRFSFLPVSNLNLWGSNSSTADESKNEIPRAEAVSSSEQEIFQGNNQISNSQHLQQTILEEKENQETIHEEEEKEVDEPVEPEKIDFISSSDNKDGNDHSDDFDDFDEFASTAPIRSIKNANDPVILADRISGSMTSNTTKSINEDLLDIFGPNVTTYNAKETTAVLNNEELLKL